MATGILSKEVAIYAVPLVTLLLGILIGYLAQRSGYCSIGGFRDYVLFRHARLLSGYVTLIVASFFGYLLFWFVTPAAMEHFFWALTSNPLMPVPRCWTISMPTRRGCAALSKRIPPVTSILLLCKYTVRGMNA